MMFLTKFCLKAEGSKDKKFKSLEVWEALENPKHYIMKASKQAILNVTKKIWRIHHSVKYYSIRL